MFGIDWLFQKPTTNRKMHRGIHSDHTDGSTRRKQGKEGKSLSSSVPKLNTDKMLNEQTV